MFRFAHFFIDRPIFAAVLSILLTLAGAIVQRGLPISEYPEIAPPTVSITATYPELLPKSWPPQSPRRSSRK